MNTKMNANASWVLKRRSRGACLQSSHVSVHMWKYPFIEREPGQPARINLVLPSVPQPLGASRLNHRLRSKNSLQPPTRTRPDRHRHRRETERRSRNRKPPTMNGREEALAASHILDKYNPTRLSWKEIKDSGARASTSCQATG